MRQMIIFSFLVMLYVLPGCAPALDAIETLEEDINLHGLTAKQYQYVFAESKVGGRLDFSAQLGEQTFFLLDSVIYSRNDAALYTWGQAMRQLGVISGGDAVLLYEDVTDTSLREAERRALIAGFTHK